MDYNNGFSISSFFLSLLSFLWIGAQFPQEKFLSYGRILTLHYYFLLMCIFFSILFFILKIQLQDYRLCGAGEFYDGLLRMHLMDILFWFS
jgi:NhaP-type Na+/H+ or K+/H+ antiporter